MGNFDLLKLTMHRLASLLGPLYYTLSHEAGLTDHAENKVLKLLKLVMKLYETQLHVTVVACVTNTDSLWFVLPGSVKLYTLTRQQPIQQSVSRCFNLNHRLHKGWQFIELQVDKIKLNLITPFSWKKIREWFEMMINIGLNKLLWECLQNLQVSGSSCGNRRSQYTLVTEEGGKSLHLSGKDILVSRFPSM